MVKMKFPELIKERNTTYETALLGYKHQTERKLHQAWSNLDSGMTTLFEIRKEMKRWNLEDK